MSRWRTGRKLGRTIYRQDGAEPSDNDAFLGMMESATLAERVVEAHNRFVGDGGVGDDRKTESICQAEVEAVAREMAEHAEHTARVVSAHAARERLKLIGAWADRLDAARKGER